MPSDSPETHEPRVESIRFRFRIGHLFYGTALIASSLATFGFGGLYPASVLLAGWTYVFISKSRSKALVAFVTIAVFGHCCLCLPVGHPGEAAHLMYCSNNLKQIALALHNYHDTYKTFPPAMIPDADGSVRFLPLALPRDVASALLLRDDGAEVDLDDSQIVFRPVARLRLDNCFRLALFIIIAVLPLPWVWRKPETLDSKLG